MIGMRLVGLAAPGLLLLLVVTVGTVAAPDMGVGGTDKAVSMVDTPPARPDAMLASGCPAAPYGIHRSAPGSGKTIALTFDDGPGKSTAAILSTLTRYHVPATFFNLGQNMAIRPAVMRTEARRGHAMGNHTWDHPNMAQLPPARQASQMNRSTAKQKAITGTVPCAFRPPYGTYNATTLRLDQQRHMKVWLWSVDTDDWKARGSGSSYWVQRIVRLAVQEGGVLRHPIVLMHNQPGGNPATVAALPAIIKYFRSHGYRFVRL